MAEGGTRHRHNSGLVEHEDSLLELNSPVEEVQTAPAEIAPKNIEQQTENPVAQPKPEEIVQSASEANSVVATPQLQPKIESPPAEIKAEKDELISLEVPTNMGSLMEMEGTIAEITARNAVEGESQSNVA